MLTFTFKYYNQEIEYNNGTLKYSYKIKAKKSKNHATRYVRMEKTIDLYKEEGEALISLFEDAKLDGFDEHGNHNTDPMEHEYVKRFYRGAYLEVNIEKKVSSRKYERYEFTVKAASERSAIYRLIKELLSLAEEYTKIHREQSPNKAL